MLAYHYPPVSAAGTQRNVGFTRWLPSFGWTPVVLTVRAAKNRFERSGEPVPDSVEVIRTPEWDLHRLLMITTGVLNRICDLLRLQRPRPALLFDWCLPDPQIAWLTTIRGAVAARTCACVYASCSPFSSALSACLIKKATGRPVILDFRDAWALNPHGNYGTSQRRILARLEQWVVKTCDALILNTPGAERVYRRRYPEHSAKMICIPNGFDRLNVPEPEARSNGKFVIMHVGDFYRSRNPGLLLEALASIQNPDIEFVQLGPKFEGYDQFKDRVQIRIVDRVAHAEAMRLMRSASVLYLCQGWETGVTDYIAVASKTYEYMATGLPIIADCPPGDNADVVQNYATRSWVVTSRDPKDVEAAVRDAYDARALPPPAPSASFIDTFSRERLSSMLGSVFDRAVAGTNSYADIVASPAVPKNLGPRA